MEDLLTLKLKCLFCSSTQFCCGSSHSLLFSLPLDSCCIQFQSLIKVGVSQFEKCNSWCNTQVGKLECVRTILQTSSNKSHLQEQVVWGGLAPVYKPIYHKFINMFYKHCLYKQHPRWKLSYNYHQQKRLGCLGIDKHFWCMIFQVCWQNPYSFGDSQGLHVQNKKASRSMKHAWTPLRESNKHGSDLISSMHQIWAQEPNWEQIRVLCQVQQKLSRFPSSGCWIWLLTNTSPSLSLIQTPLWEIEVGGIRSSGIHLA